MALTGEEISRGIRRLFCGFMTPDIQCGAFWEFENRHCEVTILPEEVLFHRTFPRRGLPIGTYPEELILKQAKSYVDGAVAARRVLGYGARLSADGFLDCTDWAVFPTRREALEYLVETYDDSDDSDDF